LLLFRLHLASDPDAARFFGAYSEVLELKYDQRANLMRRPNFFSFETPEDGVFLRCMSSDCFILEGGSRAMFDRLTMEMGWPAGPVAPVNPSNLHVNETAFPIYPGLTSDASRTGFTGCGKNRLFCHSERSEESLGVLSSTE
jgi:hypothetical protein